MENIRRVTSKMKYAIMGSGGTGGCIGGYLANTGCDVTMIARGKHLKAIKEKGLTLETSEKGTFNLKIKACGAEEYKDKADVIFVCVKYYSVDEAVEFIKKASHKYTAVIPILNVFGTGAYIQEKVGALTVTDGCVYIYSFIKEYGVIAKPSDIFKVYFGLREGQDKKALPILERVKEDLAKSGIEPYLSHNIKKDTFRKFTYISPVASAGLYCNATAGDFIKEGEARTILIALTEELLALGKAMGIEYREDMVQTNLDIIAGLKPDADTSMQRDIAKGNKSEIEGLLHQIVRWGKEYNVPMPTYEMVSYKYKKLKKGVGCL